MYLLIKKLLDTLLPLVVGILGAPKSYLAVQLSDRLLDEALLLSVAAISATSFYVFEP